MTDTRTAVIFDVDGTLCDVRTVRHHVLTKPKDFDAFHAGAAACPPHQHVVDAARAAVDAVHQVFICTGRMERWRPSTAAWLRDNGVRRGILLMRPDGDYRPDVEVKRDMLADIRSRGYEVVHAWDDNPNIIELWRAEGIDVTVVPGWDESAGSAAVSGSVGRCVAVLEHSHGMSGCFLPAGHDGQHEGECDMCADTGHDDPLDHLFWDKDREDWTKGRRR